MRNLLAATSIIMIALLSPAMANNLILIPTGSTLTTGQVRAEAAVSVDGAESHYYWLGTGLKQYELNVTRFQRPGLDAENIAEVQFSFLPETILTPGVAFGVNDFANQSEQGIAPYAVISRSLPLGQSALLLKSLTATVGIGALGIRGPFFGFEAELPANIVVEGEYDSRDFNGAIGWKPISMLMLKAYSIRRETFVGAELVPLTF